MLRITVIRELTMGDELIKEYADLIKKASPDFIEVKGYMSVGFARERLGYDRMPNWKEVNEFSKKIVKLLDGYEKLDSHEYSRVVLLGKDKKKMKIKVEEI